MEDTENTVEGDFTFDWDIKYLRYSLLQSGEFICSPSITLPNFLDTTWHLRLYPKGKSAKYAKFMLFILKRENDYGPEYLPVKYDYSINCVTYKSDEKTLRKNEEHCYEILPSCSLYASSQKYFTVVFKMYFSDFASCNLLNIEKIFPSAIKSGSPHFMTSLEKLKIQAGTQVNKITKLLASPTNCFALCQFCLDSKTIEWPIDHKIMDDAEYSQSIPIVFSENSISVIITLSRRTGDFMSMDMCLGNEIVGDALLIIFRLTLLVDETELVTLYEEEHEFKTVEDVWHLEALNIFDLKAKLNEVLPGVPKWKFEISFPNGVVRSEIVSVKYQKASNEQTPSRHYDCLISNQMLQLYNGKQFCDVVLQVKNKSFHVHKFVLSMMSPVFRAMFSADMKENETNTVEIVDFEENIVSEIISFLYTGKMKNLKFADARNLFFAADKYQIRPLMNTCRNSLIKHLNATNVCEVLSFPILHNDSLLEAAVVKIICSSKSKVLDTAEWKAFEEENSILTIRILKQCVYRCKLNYK